MQILALDHDQPSRPREHETDRERERGQLAGKRENCMRFFLFFCFSARKSAKMQVEQRKATPSLGQQSTKTFFIFQFHFLEPQCSKLSNFTIVLCTRNMFNKKRQICRGFCLVRTLTAAASADWFIWLNKCQLISGISRSLLSYLRRRCCCTNCNFQGVRRNMK